MPFSFNGSENLLDSYGEAYYIPNCFPQGLADEYFSYLKDKVEWRQEAIKMFGKELMQPRLTALYGDPTINYKYSGICMNAIPFPSVIIQIKERVEGISESSFSHVLLNYYRNGQDSMGWHRDNEKELGLDPVIASVTFGESRIFQLRNYKDKKHKVSVLLEHGSLLLMTGSTQHYWEHQLPKSAKKIGGRINLTFRNIKRE